MCWRSVCTYVHTYIREMYLREELIYLDAFDITLVLQAIIMHFSLVYREV